MSNLNRFQLIARKAYANGDFSHVKSIDDVNCPHVVNDWLFKFIMIELDDGEDCEDIDEAIGRMERAREDINDVLDALRKEEH